MNRTLLLLASFVLALAALAVMTTVQGVQAQCTSRVPPLNSPNLGTARTYAVLASSTVTNSGSSVLTGNLGLYPATSVTGFPPGLVTGKKNVANSAANVARNTAIGAYNTLKAKSPGVTMTVLDGAVLGPGTYSSGSSMTLGASGPGTLILDGLGNPDSVWVFRLGSTLMTGQGGVAEMSFINGGSPANVYWQVSSSATINVTPGSNFIGNVIATSSVTVGSGVAQGSIISLTGAVTISSASDIRAVSLLSGCSATRKPTAPTTLRPTREPTLFSPTKAPVSAAQRLCVPRRDRTDKAGCMVKIRKCAILGFPMQWVNPGCQFDGGLHNNHKYGDGGCQCAGYCGFPCQVACEVSGRCLWGAATGCTRKDGKKDLSGPCPAV